MDRSHAPRSCPPCQNGRSALPECPEGILKWVPIDQVDSLPLWEGDRVFLPLLRTRRDCFSLKLIYRPGGELDRWALDEGMNAE